ncbi:hypothetical protein LCGC14_0828620 [marine sediment metagenome]|uniref:N4-gp56 family major capsid protein n=1 Tax=marine sediment metagenome TaxID=412755 RepID=A0A0F9SP10_9ZZZZ
MADTTLTQITPGVNVFYVRKMLQAARPLLVHTRWAQVKDIPKKNTLAIRFRRYTLLSPATTPLSEGITPSGSRLSITNINATVAQYGDYVTLTDLVVLTTLDPLLTENTSVLGQQTGNTLDQLCRDVITAGTTIQYSSTSTQTSEITAGMKLNSDEVKEAVRTLQGNDAHKMMTMINPSTGFNTTPIAAAYIGIISHSTLFDLKNDTAWIPVQEYATQKGVMDGEVGAMDDVRFVMTTNAATESSTVTVHKTLILAQNFYGISRISGAAIENIVMPLGSGGSSDPLKQRATQGWKATFVAKILNENFAVLIEHAVSS